MADDVHPVDQFLPVPKLLTLGLQHVLVMYAGAVAVPLILGRALKLPPDDVAFLISADLFTCGLATLVQCIGFPGVGIRLPVMMGVTFASVGPMLSMAAVPDVGLLGIYGSVIAAGVFAVLVAPFMGRLLPLFPPVVTGTIILVIGVSLMRVGNQLGRGRSADLDQRRAPALGHGDRRSHYGGARLASEDVRPGRSRASGRAGRSRHRHVRHGRGLGVTGVRSRWVTATGGLIMVALGLLPKMSALVEAVPVVVLGGAGIVMFGMVAATGARILTGVDFKTNRYNLFVVAIAVGFGMIPLVAPNFFQYTPEVLRPLLELGILLAAIVSVLLNLFSNGLTKTEAAFEEAAAAAGASEHA